MRIWKNKLFSLLILGRHFFWDRRNGHAFFLHSSLGLWELSCCFTRSFLWKHFDIWRETFASFNSSSNLSEKWREKKPQGKAVNPLYLQPLKKGGLAWSVWESPREHSSDYLLSFEQGHTLGVMQTVWPGTWVMPSKISLAFPESLFLSSLFFKVMKKEKTFFSGWMNIRGSLSVQKNLASTSRHAQDDLSKMRSARGCRAAGEAIIVSAHLRRETSL